MVEDMSDWCIAATSFSAMIHTKTNGNQVRLNFIVLNVVDQISMIVYTVKYYSESTFITRESMYWHYDNIMIPNLIWQCDDYLVYVISLVTELMSNPRGFTINTYIMGIIR